MFSVGNVRMMCILIVGCLWLFSKSGVGHPRSVDGDLIKPLAHVVEIDHRQKLFEHLIFALIMLRFVGFSGDVQEPFLSILLFLKYSQ